jgi:hypothetical protein
VEGHQAQAGLEVEVPVRGLVFLALKALVDLTALAAEV